MATPTAKQSESNIRKMGLEIALIALGGAIGCLTRFGVENLGVFGDNKYLYTLFINMTGCLIIGTLCAIFMHYNVARIWYLFVFTGCLGGYTTYSAFTLDAMLLVQQHRFSEMIWYVSLTFAGGLGGCALGYFGTSRLIKMLCS